MSNRISLLLTDNQTEIEALKIIFGSLVYRDIIIKDIIEILFQNYKEMYEKNSDVRILEIMILIIKALTDIGIVYSDFKQQFDEVLSLYTNTKNHTKINRSYFINSSNLKLSKSNMRKIFGKWNKNSKNELTYEELLDDILLKCNASTGVYVYEHYKATSQSISKYKLIVNNRIRYIYSYDKNRYYFFDI